MAEKINYNDLFSKDVDKGIKQLIADLNKLEKEMKDISKSAKSVKVANNGTGKAYKENAKAIEDVNSATKFLIAKQKEKLKIEKAILSSLAKKNQATTRNAKLLIDQKEQVRKLNMELKDSVRADKAKAGSLEQLEARLRKARRAYAQLSKAERDNTKVGGKVLKNIKDLAKEQDDLRRSMQQSQQRVGDYTGALDRLKVGFSKFVGAAGLIAGFGAALVGMGKVIGKTNKIQNKLRFTFGATGQELNNQTSLVQSLASTYETDYNEVLLSANALSKEFGITGSESLSLITTGFQKGANNSEEFLDILKEYPAQLKTVGLDAEESIAIITQQVKEGIFSDKGIDAIKEAGERLGRMEKPAVDALESIGFSAKEIQKGIENGTTSIFDVVQLVSERMSTLNPEATTTKKALEGIFGTAGVDAGIRYVSMLKDIDTQLTNLPNSINAFAAAQANLTLQWNSLITSISQGSGALGQFSTTLTQLGGRFLREMNQISSEGFGAMTDFTALMQSSANNADNALQTLNSSLGSTSAELVRLQRSGQRGSDAFEESTETFEEQKAVLRLLFTEMQTLNLLTDESTSIFRRHGIEIQTVVDIEQDAVVVVDDLTDSQGDQNDVLVEGTGDVKDHIQAIKDLAKERAKNRAGAIPRAEEIAQGTDTDDIDIEIDEDVFDAFMDKLLAFQEETDKTLLDRYQAFMDTNGAMINEYSNMVLTSLENRTQAELDATNQSLELSNTRLEGLKSDLDQEIALNEAGVASNIDGVQAEIQAEKDKQAELEAAKLKEETRLKKLGVIRKRAAQAEIAINLAVELANLAKAASQNPTNGFTFGLAGVTQLIISSGLALARSELQSSKIDAAQFADGTEFVPLNGNKKGTDTIPAFIDEGERILSKKDNAKLPSWLNNKDLPSYVMAGVSAMDMGGLNLIESSNDSNALIDRLDISNDLLSGINSNTGIKSGTTLSGQRFTIKGSTKIIN